MKLRFKAISPVILSPRMEKALYKGVDFKKIASKDMKAENTENINIIYPFYSYENRDLLSENNFSYAKEYYIPASSLKGALLENKKDEEKNSLRSKILFHDAKISNSHIKLKNLYKFQYLYQDDKKKDNNKNRETGYKTPKLATFFPGIAIEMLESEKEFESEILLKSSEITEEFFMKKLNKNFDITKKKLKNYISEIKNIINFWEKIKKKEKNQEKEYIKKLNEIKCNVQNQLDKNMIFLGGYKGILGSLSNYEVCCTDEDTKDKQEPQEQILRLKNGFYIDENTLLPYGLVEVYQ